MRTVLFAALACAPLFAATGLDYGPQSPTAVQIDDYLTSKHSPIVGIGAALTQLARDYDVDPRLIVAIAGAETTFGQHLCADHNAWNWFHRGTCAASTFVNYQEGAEHVTKFMRLSYLNRGYETIEQIRYKYCTTGCDNWTPLVTAFHDAMPVNAVAAPPARTPVVQTPNVPTPNVQTAPPPVAPATERKFLGLPLYLVFFIGAVLVGAWALGGLKR